MMHRIVSRHPFEVLEEELGSTGAGQCQASSKRQVMHGLSVLDAERRCSELAEREGIDVALLKFAALRHYCGVGVSNRPVSDLDLLVREADIAPLTDALLGIGATRVTHWVPSHHPAVVRMPSGRSVELHVRLAYVTTDKKRDSATLEMMKAAGLLQPVGGATHVFLPNQASLLAHLVTHALIQHAFAPKAYPVTRLLADAIDLGVADLPELVEAATGLIAERAAARQAVALASIAAACVTGAVADVLSSDTEASKLLKHMLAASLDESYQRRLRVRRVWQLVDEVGVLATFRHWCRWLVR
ncbi:MAG: nucleotidyltransferase family protein [Myxococcales bacterium]